MLSIQDQIQMRTISKQGQKIKNMPETSSKGYEQSFKGLWQSEKGSLYIGDGHEFICISVYSNEFIGWVGKVTIRDIGQAEGQWYGWHAFRDRKSGDLYDWVKIRLSTTRDKITKCFPASVPSYLLLYGYVEYWYRLYQH